MSANISAHPKTSRRGQKTCPKCLTLQSNRAAFCKRKGCDHSFKNNVKRKHTTSVCKLRINNSSCSVYSVRLVLQGPDYRGFVEHQLYSNTGVDSNQNRKSIVKCLVDSCLKKSPSEQLICPHIESTFNCFTEAEVLPISSEMLSNIQIPLTAKAEIRKRLNGMQNCLVQRVSRQVMVVNNSQLTDSIDLKHCSFYTENIPPQKIESKHRFSCSCKSHIKKKKKSTKKGRLLKEVKKYRDPKIIISPAKCWHYYACVAAFASQQHLIKEFDPYIKLCEINLFQSLDNFSPEHIEVDVDLRGDTMIMDCDSDVFNMTDFNLDLCLNKTYDTSNYPLSTITLPDSGNSHVFNLENEKDNSEIQQIENMHTTQNIPIEICSTEEAFRCNENLHNDIFSPVEIVDVFTSDIDNYLSTCSDNMADQSSIEIITFDKVENMVDNSIEFDINNEVTVGNEIDQAILLNDDNMFIQLNDRDTLVFPEDEDILSDGTFDLHCTDDNLSKLSISHDNSHKKKPIKKLISNSNPKLENIDTTLKVKTDVGSSTFVDSNTQNSLVSEMQLDFLEWLASITERINETMHFQLRSGKPDPLIFHVNQVFFQSFSARMSPDPSKRRMPDLTSRYEPNKPPFGSYTMFTWRLTNIFQIKNIFETPKVPLKFTRVFIRKPNGNYSATIEQNVKTSTKTAESTLPDDNSEMKKNLVMTYLKIDKSIPFCIEWIPDLFPITRTGELRIIFEFGHRRIIRV